MFSLRPSKSERCLRKLKKPRFNLSWSPAIPPPLPEADFVAFHNVLPSNTEPAPLPISAPTTRRSRCISTCGTRRDTILLDLTNNDLIPALDYAFAILDADESSRTSHNVSKCPSSSSTTTSPPLPSTPLSLTYSTSSGFVSPPTSVRSAPPRYHLSTLPGTDAQPFRNMNKKPSQLFKPDLDCKQEVDFDPDELTSALSHVQHARDSTPQTPLPFPPSPERSSIRVPLLQRKLRLLHTPQSSIDGHDTFVAPYASMSKVSLVRSASSLDPRHNQEYFFYPRAYPSSVSVNTMDSGLAQLFAGHTSPHSSSSSLKIFPSPKKFRKTLVRRASTPPNASYARRPPLGLLLDPMRADAVSACR